MLLTFKMLLTNQTQVNVSVELQRQELLGLVVSCIVTTLPCCVFLFINVTTLYTLRSKPVFKETSRYILLFNLLFADTVQLAHSQSMFLLPVIRVALLFPVCVALTALYSLSHRISSITLLFMCLERYVAVCFPLRHSAIITIRNTKVVICVIWMFSLLNSIIQLIIMLRFSFQDLQHLQMTDYCGKEGVYVDPMSDIYDKFSTYFLFALGGVTVIFSYTGIMIAARTASTNKVSAKRARRTLLLHLVQMGLTMSSTIQNSLISVVSKNVDRVVTVRMQICLYICINILPKCLSCLIYGLRDRTIRSVLIFNLSCQWGHSSMIPDIQARKKIPVR
ncbi:odorant receptor 131-2-like [Nothobranchius furzeri]|uniref:Olfactory receptor-like protein OLF4 n=1 Tax=Nothobranchius furzeri TaxID=105023 RepID=A0A8C6LJL8_NOTFU|nr:olfactory receptor-like protein OLF4 [Nothobranchius furzeri]